MREPSHLLVPSKTSKMKSKPFECPEFDLLWTKKRKQMARDGLSARTYVTFRDEPVAYGAGELQAKALRCRTICESGFDKPLTLPENVIDEHGMEVE